MAPMWTTTSSEEKEGSETQGRKQRELLTHGAEVPWETGPVKDSVEARVCLPLSHILPPQPQCGIKDVLLNTQVTEARELFTF